MIHRGLIGKAALTSALLVTATAPLHAQEESELLDMSLEQLMDVHVSTVSKR